MRPTPKQPTSEQLERYYASLAREDRYCTRCVMHLPSDLEGKRVLDLECRRGKGVFTIADQVGPTGFVIGVDSSASYIASALEQAPKNHPAGKDWPNYLRFAYGYFEDLLSSGIGEGSIDVVIVNSVLNLAYDLKQAFEEIHRVLKPGGYLYHANVFSATPLPSDLIETLRVDGNVFGAALTVNAYESLVRDVGFSDCRLVNTSPVEPSGLDKVEALEGYRFTEGIVEVWK